MAFNNFQALLRQQESQPESVGSVVAARALLSLSLAGLAYPQFESKLPGDTEDSILVAPCANGVLDFYVDSTVGDSVHFLIGPDDFDPARHEQHMEFKAYRAFVDDARRLPVKTGDSDGRTHIGPFSIFCTPDDVQKWAAVWALWEHAHGE